MSLLYCFFEYVVTTGSSAMRLNYCCTGTFQTLSQKRGKLYEFCITSPNSLYNYSIL